MLLVVIDDTLETDNLLFQFGRLLLQLLVLKALLSRPSRCGLKSLLELLVVQLDRLQGLPHVCQQLDLPREMRSEFDT